MAHDHNHHHSHHDVNEFNSKFKLGITLNIVFVLVEFSFGIIYDSLALIADAGHNLTDVAGLVIAWGANYLSQRKPSEQFTYGLKKTPILGAQINSLLLLVAIGVIIWEAVDRLNNPESVDGIVLIVVAGIGVIINGITTYLFHSGKDSDLNIKGAYLHMLADTLISVGVVISGIIIIFTNAVWIDPTISIIIAVVIFWSTWKLLQDATKLSLDGVPENIDLKEVREYFNNNKFITNYHHLHVWPLSTSETALTVHVISNNQKCNDELLDLLNCDLSNKFNIQHATIQIEEEFCENGC